MKKMLQPKVLLSAVISGLAICHLLYSVDFRQVSTQLSNCKLFSLLLASLLVVGHLWIRAIRWRVFLPSTGTNPCSYKLLFDGLGVSNFCNYLLPLRAGEILRAWFVAMNSSLTAAEAISTVVVERLFDLIVVLFSFSLLWLYGTDFHPLILFGAQTLSIIALGLSAAVIATIFFSDLILALVNAIYKKAPTRLHTVNLLLRNGIIDFIECSRVLNSLKTFSAACGLSVLAWITNYASIYYFIDAVGISVTPLMAVTSGVVIALAVAAPALPGFIGVYQWASIIGLGLFDISADAATAFSLLSHLTLYALYIGYGLWILNHYTLSFRSLAQLSRGELRYSNYKK